MKWVPPGYGGERRPPEEVKRDGWREQGLLAVSVDDHRLTWLEREFVRQLGGCGHIAGEARPGRFSGTTATRSGGHRFGLGVVVLRGRRRWCWERQRSR